MAGRLSRLGRSNRGALAAAVLLTGMFAGLAGAETYKAPRGPDGVHPDLNGVWQALNAANYSFLAGGLPVSLTGSTFEYDETSFTVNIELSDSVNLQFGDTVALTLSNVTDLSGNALAVQPADATVAGDNTDPGFQSATSAFVNFIFNNTGRTIDVQFSEDVDETFVETVANWTTSGTTVVQGVTLLTPNIARITTDVQIAAGETLGLTNLPDLAGNNGGGAITVNPIE